MATLIELKEELGISWNNDDSKLQRKLDAAIRIIERYTNRSLTQKTVTLTSYGYPIEFYGSPILSVTGAKTACYNPMGGTFFADEGDDIEVSLGVSDIPSLTEAVIRVAATLYENGEVSEVNLPVDVQLLVNQFRLDSFID